MTKVIFFLGHIDISVCHYNFQPCVRVFQGESGSEFAHCGLSKQLGRADFHVTVRVPSS